MTRIQRGPTPLLPFAQSFHSRRSLQSLQSLAPNHCESFLDDVVRGLSGPRKSISSRWFYDDEGSRIFEEIMRLPEYYPSRCEAQILSACKEPILRAMGEGEGFHLVDLGSGNGEKTRILLDY